MKVSGVNRKRIQRLMRQMGMRGFVSQGEHSRPAAGHKIYPYRLRDVVIERPNQSGQRRDVYSSGARLCLSVAIMEWHSRKVLAWRLSPTLAADFCVDALEEALSTYGAPAIFNTDQGGAVYQ